MNETKQMNRNQHDERENEFYAPLRPFSNANECKLKATEAIDIIWQTWLQFVSQNRVYDVYKQAPLNQQSTQIQNF